MQNYGAFLNDEAFWDHLWQWWSSLQTDRGDRARLRRTKTPFEVFVSPAYQRNLIAPLQRKGLELTASEQERLALCVGVLANVGALTKGPHFARQLATCQAASDNVRDQRFMKLLSVTDRDALFVMLRRLLRYLGGTTDLKSLVAGAFWWNDRTRRSWAIQYYANTNA